MCGRKQQDNCLSGSRIPSLHLWRGNPAGHSDPRSTAVRQCHLHSPTPPPIHGSTAHQVEVRPRNRDPTSALLFNTPQQQQRLPDHEACFEEHGRPRGGSRGEGWAVICSRNLLVEQERLEFPLGCRPGILRGLSRRRSGPLGRPVD